jgi:hypothetical protein
MPKKKPVAKPPAPKPAPKPKRTMTSRDYNVQRDEVAKLIGEEFVM